MLGCVCVRVPAANGITQPVSLPSSSFPLLLSLQILDGLLEGTLQSGSAKPQVSHHALALYQQQITKAHESAREDSAQSKPAQQQPAEKEPSLSTSPRAQSKSPTGVDKEGE